MRASLPIFGRAVLAGLILGAAGCSVLPEPKADPTRLFILAAPTGSFPEGRAEGPALLLRPVEVAGYLEGAPLVVRRGDHEVEFRDYARWAEPLAVGVARVVREHLLAAGRVQSVELSRLGSRSGGTALDLRIRLLACEGVADGSVRFRAGWELTGNEGVSRQGVFQPDGLRWSPDDEATLAAALSEAVAGLAAEISRTLSE